MSLAAHYLAALATPGVGLVGLRRLVGLCGGLAAALDGGCARRLQGAAEPLRLGLPELQRTVRRGLPAAQRTLLAAAAAGLSVTCWEDAAYPPALYADEAGCAPVLFVEGGLPAQVMAEPGAQAACAVVGTRRASAFARGFARDLGRAAARRGITVVSGLALGVDAEAHQGALESGLAAGATVAVLGGGHGRLHPAANRGLARAIVEQGGAVVSAWAPDVNPQRYHFLQRNRTIAGLARVVAVVEAGERSGALSTATHAADLGRQVLSVPSRPGEVGNLGGLQLLGEGAMLLLYPDDLLSHFTDVPAPPAAPNGSPAEAEAGGAAPAPALPGGELGARLREAFRRLGAPTLDQLARFGGAPPHELLAAIGLLELEGLVVRTEEGRFRWRA